MQKSGDCSLTFVVYAHWTSSAGSASLALPDRTDHRSPERFLGRLSDLWRKNKPLISARYENRVASTAQVDLALNADAHSSRHAADAFQLRDDRWASLIYLLLSLYLVGCIVVRTAALSACRKAGLMLFK